MSQPDGPHDGLEVGEASPLAATALRRMTWVVVGVTVVGLVVPGAAGTMIAWVVIGLLIAVPMVRVLWLGTRWFNRGDTRFALAAALLVMTVATGAVVTALIGG